jgi:carbon-monoxide dehydrogenase medium subunit
LSTKHYFLPESQDEALALLAEHGPSLLVMAGGTLAMPLINEGVSMPEKVMGLRRAKLDGIQHSDGELVLGAATPLSKLQVLEAATMLPAAARHIGGWQVRNMGTVGGNLFAPPPAGDLAVALLALDAQVKLASCRGRRTLPLTDFYTGFLTTALEPDELVTEILVPVPSGRTAYLKYGRKHANTPAIVTVAATLTLNRGKVTDARVALNGVGPHPIRARGAEAALASARLDDGAIAAAAKAAAAECEPFSDAIASDWYRREMVDVYVRRALAQIAA